MKDVALLRILVLGGKPKEGIISNMGVSEVVEGAGRRGRKTG